MRLWQVITAEFKRTPLSTRGSFLVPGRWHSAGNEVLYSAETESLAKTERFVHLAQETGPAFVLLELSLPDTATSERDVMLRRESADFSSVKVAHRTSFRYDPRSFTQQSAPKSSTPQSPKSSPSLPIRLRPKAGAGKTGFQRQTKSSVLPVPSIDVILNLSPEQCAAHYAGVAKQIRARSVDGRSVLLPADVLRQLVTRDGVQGVYRLTFGAGGKIESVSRVAAEHPD